MADNRAHTNNRSRVLTIDDLPDDDLLAIFGFCVVRHQYLGFGQLNKLDVKRKIKSWQSLVHVCRRWRDLVFGSPRHLNLQLFCNPRGTARNSLDVWPALPLIVLGHNLLFEKSVDRVIAQLEQHRDRICHIELSCFKPRHIEKLWRAMQVPFPELVVLRMSSRSGESNDRALPDSFLGGSAPRLRCLALDAVQFPGLSNLLLFATHLVHLGLFNISQSGYISPESMATCLSVLTSLETLSFCFQSPHSFPHQEIRRPLPPTRFVLPALTEFRFRGVREYLEELVSRIDTPRLYQLSITFFDNIDLDTPELTQFISRTPTFGAYNEARIIFGISDTLVRLQYHPDPGQSDHGMVEVITLCQVRLRQLSSLAQICTSSLRPLLTMENLYFQGKQFLSYILREFGNNDWLDLLLPFTAVKNLYLSDLFWPRMVIALQELTWGRTTELLPALKNVLLEGFRPPVHDGIAQFIFARELTNHPVAISVWDRSLVRDEAEEVDD